ncbi:MAG: hypothetical protein JSS96_00980 [Bacteroidetes bacterium]|nr:hypothetical protein [Bacteroidota bacterium]
MSIETKDTSLETLQEIRTIMERSARFLSLSGWSGVWAGSVALVGAVIAHYWLLQFRINQSYRLDEARIKFIFLGIIIFIAALMGGFFFTAQKVRKQGHTLWNNASRQLLLQILVPLATGGVFVLAFISNANDQYIAPACLVFYGLALINCSKYTLSDIRYLGYLEVLLGCINIFFAKYGLYFWTAGFGILHILYGIIMWNKYDRHTA